MTAALTAPAAVTALAAFGYAAGSLLQAVGVRAAGLRSPLYLAGLGCDAVAWLLSLVALRRLPAFAVQSLLAASLALTVLLARVVLGTRLRRRDTAAVLALVAALGVLARAGREGAPAAVGRGVEVGSCVVAAVLLLGVLALRRGGPVALAVLAGLGCSVAALSARAVTVPGAWWRTALEPAGWAVVLAGVAGTLGYAAALERGAVGPVTALLWAVEVVVPALAGPVLLGDSVRAGWLPATAAALLVVVVCSVVLAGSPAVSEES
ncbi:hypothetical protein [Kineococcus sp. SYSU DK005]|uniref:hypothetical protein n=1 Tax=Kineococcus sp. SYSU DK005 TaxID=3383126 RepID=UPI003D7DDF4C